jgi:hypothetical protein
MAIEKCLDYINIYTNPLKATKDQGPEERASE